MIFFIGCFPDNKNISYDEEIIVEESNIMEDRSYMKSINMPIHFDSVDYIIFQNTKTDEIKYLTNYRIIDNKFRYLREAYKKTGKKHLVLEIRDKDSNKDGDIDNKDIISLYICKISGNKLQKLTPENQNLLNWKVDNKLNKLYFQTRQDINKDGIFDTKDIILLYFVDFFKNIKTSKINFKH